MGLFLWGINSVVFCPLDTDDKKVNFPNSDDYKSGTVWGLSEGVTQNPVELLQFSEFIHSVAHF